MPEIGEETRADSIGKAGNGRKYVWVFCPVCKEERWVYKKYTKSPTARLCQDCNIRTNAKKFHL